VGAVVSNAIGEKARYRLWQLIAACGKVAITDIHIREATVGKDNLREALRTTLGDVFKAGTEQTILLSHLDLSLHIRLVNELRRGGRLQSAALR
jgi:hypothetical protein